MTRAEVKRRLALAWWQCAVGTVLLLWVRSLRRAVSERTRELSRERARLNAVIGAIPDLVWLKDPQGVYLGCNRAFEGLYGTPEAQIVGKTDRDFVDEATSQSFRHHDQKAMAAEQPARRMGPGGSPSGAETQALADPLTYQKLAIFVPETAGTQSAMILNVNNGGWFASELRPGITDGGAYVSDSDTDKVGAALAAGYVYVDIGSRGRGIVAADGSLPGKAPAAVPTGK